MNDSYREALLQKFSEVLNGPGGGPACCDLPTAWAWVEIIAGLRSKSEEARKLFPRVLDHALEVSETASWSKEHGELVIKAAYAYPDLSKDPTPEEGYLYYWHQTHPEEPNAN